jgi:hypothetical protein
VLQALGKVADSGSGVALNSLWQSVRAKLKNWTVRGGYT